MSRHKPRFEIVTTGIPNALIYHARFIAGNGRVVWWTEGYAKRTDALRAVELVTERQVFDVQGHLFVSRTLGTCEVRQVDERGKS